MSFGIIYSIYYSKLISFVSNPNRYTPSPSMFDGEGMPEAGVRQNSYIFCQIAHCSLFIAHYILTLIPTLTP